MRFCKFDSFLKECLRDIDRSLINGLFPEASAHKLISRRLRCLVKLGGNQRLKADIERLTLYLSGCQMDPSKKGNQFYYDIYLQMANF